MNYRLIFKEKIHSMLNLVMTLVMIFSVFLSNNLLEQLFYFSMTLIYFSFCGTELKNIIKTLSLTLSFSVLYILMPILFPNSESLLYGKSFFEIFDRQILLSSKEFSTFCRLFFVSSISVLSLFVIKAEVVLLYIAQTTQAPVILIYPLLFAVNSIQLFKKKFDLYLFNNKLRQVKGFVLPRLLFQFLVFVLRFSESGSLSLVSRGLSKDKIYYYDFSIEKKDWLTAASFLILTAFLQLILDI